MSFENSRESETNKWSRIVRNEKIFLTGKESFCKKAGEIFLWANKKLYAVENI